MTTAPTIGSAAKSTLPARAGVGLKATHAEAVLGAPSGVAWFEVHTENYMGAGGPPHRFLAAVRRDHPLSLHGVGLSLGNAAGVDDAHLARIAAVARRYQPAVVSEHLSWSITGGVYFNDLIALPYTEEALAVVVRNVEKTQEVLGRTILVENPSTYFRYTDSPIPEPAFLVEVCRRTGCGLLLDVNNIYVSAENHGFDPGAYLDAIPPDLVGEIHLAGHHVARYEDRLIRIDDHGSAVPDAVR